MLIYNPSELLQPLQSSFLQEKQVEVWVLALQHLHPQISGNKWFKLKYNLLEAQKQQKNTLLTFGGAYSNHIYATAQAGKLAGFKTIGIIRGEETLPLNTTLDFAKNECQMYLHYIDRATYKEKHTSEFIKTLKSIFGDFYLIPEGGANALALLGCGEIIENLPLSPSHICLSVGIGATLAGILTKSDANQTILGFSALKNGFFLNEEVLHFLKNAQKSTKSNFEIIENYHFGGYAKKTKELESFMSAFEKNYGIKTDFVYTAKMFFGLFEEIKNGRFPLQSKIMAIHTGGLRG